MRFKSVLPKTTWHMEGGLKKALVSLKGISFAFIYGSFASERKIRMSDIDMMVIRNPDNVFA